MNAFQGCFCSGRDAAPCAAQLSHQGCGLAGVGTLAACHLPLGPVGALLFFLAIYEPVPGRSSSYVSS